MVDSMISIRYANSNNVSSQYETCFSYKRHYFESLCKDLFGFISSLDNVAIWQRFIPR